MTPLSILIRILLPCVIVCTAYRAPLSAVMRISVPSKGPAMARISYAMRSLCLKCVCGLQEEDKETCPHDHRSDRNVTHCRRSGPAHTLLARSFSAIG